MATFYHKPPLPFQGNKKNQLKNFISLLENMKIDGIINEKTVFYDVFGGSGLLANTIKTYFPNNRVVWNDYDDYQSRLNTIEITQKIKDEIYKEVIQYINRTEKINKQDKDKILQIINRYDESEVDILTLSSSLLFSGNYAHNMEQLKKYSFYNKFTVARLIKKGYLEGVERVKMDFNDLIDSIPKELRDNNNAFLILDPPYLQTNVDGYSVKYWTLKSFLTLITKIFKPFVLFSSSNSDIIEFLDFINTIKGFEYLQGYKIMKAHLSLNKSVQLKDDFMIYLCNRMGLFENL